MHDHLNICSHPFEHVPTSRSAYHWRGGGRYGIPLDQHLLSIQLGNRSRLESARGEIGGTDTSRHSTGITATTPRIRFLAFIHLGSIRNINADTLYSQSIE
jgi:hypothetical protein